MSRPFDSSLLSGYLDGELDADETALVERVLDQHPERLRELEALRHVQRSLSALPTPQPTVDPVAAVRARIDQKRPAAIGSKRPWWLQVTPFVLAACLLLAVGWAMLGSELKPSQLVSDRAASPSSGVKQERAESFDRVDSLSDEDFSRPSQQAERPGPALQPLTASPERSRSAGVTPETDEAAPGGLGAMAPSAPEADNATPTPKSSAPQESADIEFFSFAPEKRSSSIAMALDSSEPLRLNMQHVIRLRYEVPREEQAETVRWLRTVVPRELKKLPPAGDAKRYWFFGQQQERQELQAAINKRLEVTGGQLKVVQSADAAEKPDQEVAAIVKGAIVGEVLAEKEPSEEASAAEATGPTSERESDREMSRLGPARPDGSLQSRPLSESETRPIAIIIELFARPEE